MWFILWKPEKSIEKHLLKVREFSKWLIRKKILENIMEIVKSNL